MRTRTVIVAVAALLGFGCTQQQQLALNALTDDPPAETSWSPAPGDTRAPGTRYLNGTATRVDVDGTRSDVDPLVELCSSPVALGVSMPCAEVMNPCHHFDQDRTTMFLPDAFYCTDDRLPDGSWVMPDVADICTLPHPEFYGCRP